MPEIHGNVVHSSIIINQIRAGDAQGSAGGRDRLQAEHAEVGRRRGTAPGTTVDEEGYGSFPNIMVSVVYRFGRLRYIID